MICTGATEVVVKPNTGSPAGGITSMMLTVGSSLGAAIFENREVDIVQVGGRECVRRFGRHRHTGNTVEALRVGTDAD